MQSIAKLSASLLLAASGAVSIPAATQVHEVIHSVTVSDTFAETGSPLDANAVITGPRFIHVGADSRAEVSVGETTFRLGANTVVQVNGPAGAAQLQSGAVFYDHLASQGDLKVTLGDLQVVVRGGMGFAHLLPAEGDSPQTLSIGGLSGRSKVQVGGKKYTLNPSDVLSVSPQGVVRIASFNLAKQVDSSQFINGFETPLPHLDRIQGDRDRFVSLQKRGFIHELARIDGAAVRAPDSLEIPNTSTGDQSAKESSKTSAQAVRGSSSASQNSGAREGIVIGGANVMHASLVNLVGGGPNGVARVGLVSLVDELGFQSRTAIIAKSPHKAKTPGNRPKPPTKPKAPKAPAVHP